MQLNNITLSNKSRQLSIQCNAKSRFIKDDGIILTLMNKGNKKNRGNYINFTTNIRNPKSSISIDLANFIGASSDAKRLFNVIHEMINNVGNTKTNIELDKSFDICDKELSSGKQNTANMNILTSLIHNIYTYVSQNIAKNFIGLSGIKILNGFKTNIKITFIYCVLFNAINDTVTPIYLFYRRMCMLIIKHMNSVIKTMITSGLYNAEKQVYLNKGMKFESKCVFVPVIKVNEKLLKNDDYVLHSCKKIFPSLVSDNMFVITNDKLMSNKDVIAKTFNCYIPHQVKLMSSTYLTHQSQYLCLSSPISITYNGYNNICQIRKTLPIDFLHTTRYDLITKSTKRSYPYITGDIKLDNLQITYFIGNTKKIKQCATFKKTQKLFGELFKHTNLNEYKCLDGILFK